MCKFKVGDVVKGKSNSYSLTDKDMYKGRVIKVDEDYLVIKILEHKYARLIGEEVPCRFVEDDDFEILKTYDYKDLKKSPLGTKVTFENGQALIRHSDNGDCFENDHSKRSIADLKNLKDNWGFRNLRENYKNRRT